MKRPSQPEAQARDSATAGSAPSGVAAQPNVDALQIALALHQQGQLDQAEAIYREILRIEPRHFNALQLLATIAAQRGNSAAAVTLFDQALEINPNHVGALVNRGAALQELNHLDEALASYDRALGIGPDHAVALNNRASALVDLQRPAEALESCDRALRLQPDYADALNNRGNALRALERSFEALESYDRALRVRPDHAVTLNNRGLALQDLGRPAEALESHDRALGIRPDYGDALFGRGSALLELERSEEALESYERGLGIDPRNAEALSNRGVALLDLQRHEDALASFDGALAIDPCHAATLNNRGLVLHDLNRLDEALASYRQALRLRPDFAEAHWNYALALLLAGDLEHGWREHEWRFRSRERYLHSATLRCYPFPEWRGEPLAGKRILVWGEQGIGDQLQFAGLYPDLIAAAGHCTFECAPKLVALFSRAFPGATVIPAVYPAHPLTRGAFDYQVPAGDLARWLRPSLESFPGRSGYLTAPPERVAEWRRRLAALGPGLKVGFSWRSSNIQGNRALSCTTLDQWGAVFAVPGVHFVCLQYDECTAELDEARARHGVALHAFPEVDLYNDLEEAAALACAVDLVISAPTSVSILSGALGVTTLQMQYGLDWQRLGTSYNPWYPTLREFNRARNQDWREILEVVAGELRGYATSEAP